MRVYSYYTLRHVYGARFSSIVPQSSYTGEEASRLLHGTNMIVQCVGIYLLHGTNMFVQCVGIYFDSIVTKQLLFAFHFWQ